MSSQKAKRSARKGQQKTFGDVTINDFANSPAIKHRPKKSSTSITSIIKLENQEHNQQLKSWDDEDLHDHDYVKEETDEGKVVYVLRKLKNATLHKEGRAQDQDSSPHSQGKDYPLDIWFLISAYIRPEDVGTFAGICRASSSIVNTGKFWFTLYRRYYRCTPELPKRLHPECMFRLYGVRTLVIKSLYYMYAPFVRRLKTARNEEHPDVLNRRLCVLMWHQAFNMVCQRVYRYYIKLKEVSMYNARTRHEKVDWIEQLEDVCANSEQDCRILQVTCLNDIPLPPVQGLFLTSVGVNISSEVCYNRVQLVFNTCANYGKSHTTSSVFVVLDPVCDVRILDWWQPSYPQSFSLNLLSNDEK